MSEALSLERVLEARETLTALSRAVLTDGFPGAIAAEDPWGAFVEAKRNIAAYCRWKYGEDAFEVALAQEEKDE